MRTNTSWICVSSYDCLTQRHEGINVWGRGKLVIVLPLIGEEHLVRHFVQVDPLGK